ncbi:MAG: hypothetical protein GPJ54_08710 [Candidatus Heimdallarchaeota archaeon]|nr:hypothetical protein [Candidatus Heimdallarchaeota archaeon]
MLEITENNFEFQNYNKMAIEFENTASMKSDDDIFISVAKNIILNSKLPLKMRIIQLISTIPRKEIILKSIEQLYYSNRFDIEEYLELLETFS